MSQWKEKQMTKFYLRRPEGFATLIWTVNFRIDHCSNRIFGQCWIDHCPNRIFGQCWIDHCPNRFFGQCWIDHYPNRIFGQCWIDHCPNRIFGQCWIDHWILEQSRFDHCLNSLFWLYRIASGCQVYTVFSSYFLLANFVFFCRQVLFQKDIIKWLPFAQSGVLRGLAYFFQGLR